MSIFTNDNAINTIQKILITFIFIGLFVLLLLAIPSDNVKTHYKTYEDALGTDDYFTNGWLPDIFPKTIYDITTNNNLDLNTSYGKFYFPSTDWLKVKNKFKQSNKTEKEKFKKFVSNHSQSEIYKYQNAGSIWIFACKPQKGYCEYVMDNL